MESLPPRMIMTSTGCAEPASRSILFLHKIADGSLNLFHRMVVGSLEGTYTRAQNIGNLFILHLVEITHIEHYALFLWKSGYGLLQSLLKLIAIEIMVGLKLFEKKVIVCPVKLINSLSLARQKIQALVDGNLKQPCRQLRVAPEIGDVAPCFDKRILKYVVGIVVRHYKLTYLPIHRLAITLHKRLEGLLGNYRIL